MHFIKIEARFRSLLQCSHNSNARKYQVVVCTLYEENEQRAYVTILHRRVLQVGFSSLKATLSRNTNSECDFDLWTGRIHYHIQLRSIGSKHCESKLQHVLALNRFMISFTKFVCHLCQLFAILYILLASFRNKSRCWWRIHEIHVKTLQESFRILLAKPKLIQKKSKSNYSKFDIVLDIAHCSPCCHKSTRWRTRFRDFRHHYKQCTMLNTVSNSEKKCTSHQHIWWDVHFFSPTDMSF